MMLTQRNLRFARVLTSCLATTAAARAQCGTWDTGFPVSGTSAGSVQCQAVFDDGSGPALFIGGSFLTAGPASAEGIAKWDGSSWSALGAGFVPTGGFVMGLAQFDDGSGSRLFAAGQFQSASGIAASNIAATVARRTLGHVRGLGTC